MASGVRGRRVAAGHVGRPGTSTMASGSVVDERRDTSVRTDPSGTAVGSHRSACAGRRNGTPATVAWFITSCGTGATATTQRSRLGAKRTVAGMERDHSVDGGARSVRRSVGQRRELLAGNVPSVERHRTPSGVRVAGITTGRATGPGSTRRQPRPTIRGRHARASTANGCGSEGRRRRRTRSRNSQPTVRNARVRRSAQRERGGTKAGTCRPRRRRGPRTPPPPRDTGQAR